MFLVDFFNPYNAIDLSIVSNPPQEPPKPVINYTSDAVFVGAGPVGLWTAVQAKLLHPQSEITMLERNAEYKRKNDLNLSPDSFKDIPAHPILDELKAQVKKNPRIKTQVIEEKLRTLANELGIKIVNEKVESIASLKGRFQKPNVVFVDSSGSHSVARKEVFNNEFKVQENLQFVAMLRYKVKGETRKLNKFIESYPTSKLIKTLAVEGMGKPDENGNIQITVQFFIDSETYKEMEHATFRDPDNLHERHDLIEKDLCTKIVTWLNAKEKATEEERILGSEEISVTKLDVYCSKEVFKKDEDGTTTVLVGDALFGVPFFRSLNNGLLCGTVLAKALVKHIQNPGHVDAQVSKSSFEKLKDPFGEYAAYAMKLAKWEIFIARVKNFFISFYIWFVKISSVVPWQINRWSEANARAFRNTAAVAA